MGTLLALLLIQDERAADQAVRKGVEVLKTADGELAAWALVETGRRAPDLPPPATTTSAAIQALIYADEDLWKYLPRVALCAQQLLDTQCADGLWDAGKAVEPPQGIQVPERPPKVPAFDKPRVKLVKQKLELRARGAETGDLRNTRWALWGLLAAERAGLTAPAEVVERASAALRKLDGDPAELVSALCVCDYFLKKDYKKDPDVIQAVKRLAAQDRTSPEALFLQKKAMLHFDCEILGGVYWWEQDRKILLRSQEEDGSWGDVESTAYAVLALHYPRYLICPDRRR